jgi:hypothetical protein
MLALELFPLSKTIVTLSTLTELFFNLFNRFLAQIFPVFPKAWLVSFSGGILKKKSEYQVNFSLSAKDQLLSLFN